MPTTRASTSSTIKTRISGVGPRTLHGDGPDSSAKSDKTPLNWFDRYESNGLGPPFGVGTHYGTNSGCQQATLAGNSHCLSTALDPQLLVEVFQVVLDAVNTQRQLVGDLFIPVAPS